MSHRMGLAGMLSGAGRHRGRASLPATLLLAACAAPTDTSQDVLVTIDAPSSVLVRGSTMTIHARAWLPNEGSPGAEVAASFTFTTGDPSIATIAGQEQGVAVVTGVNGGRVEIRAVAADFKHAGPGELTLRVTNTVEIDSVRPSTVRYGDQLTVFGVGLAEVSRVSLGDVSLIPDGAGVGGQVGGEGHASFWVPYPATTARLLAVAREGFSAPAAEATEVIPTSAFGTEDGSPALIDLSEPPDQSSGVLFHNPALALTEDGKGTYFRFIRAAPGRPLTIVVATDAPVVKNIQPYFALATDSSTTISGEEGWSIGVSGQVCKGADLSVAPVNFGSHPASVARAIQAPAAGELNLVVRGESPGRFSLTVLDGSATSDPRLAPDGREDDDYCAAADDSSRRRILTGQISDNLTIDNPYDVDWLRFTVPADHPGSQLLTVRTSAEPFGAADSSDLGLHLAKIEQALRTELLEGWAAESDVPGSDEVLNAEVEPGDYYLVVSDGAGIATRYGLCIALGNTCSLPEAPAVRRVP